MEIVKGKHIILKRDKQSYDTNVCGKWENYSIDTYQGTVLKEAAERYKVLLKSGFIDDNEFTSLKSKLSQIPDTQSSTIIDLWSLPDTNGYVTVPKAEEKAIEIIKEITMDEPTPVQPAPTEQPSPEPKQEAPQVHSHKGKWVVTAGLNRVGRQRYVSIYTDCDDLDISVVPSPVSKTKALEVLARIKKEYKEKQNKTTATIAKRTEEITFEIAPWTDPWGE